MSHAALGKPPPRRADAALIRAWGGVSTFTTVERAVALARAAKLGQWVAELEVPDEVEADFGADTPSGRHIDLYGVTPAQLRECTVRIFVAVRGKRGVEFKGMGMYEIWDRTSGNRLGEFYTQAEALETVRVIVEDDAQAVDSLVLLGESEDGPVEISSGTELRALSDQLPQPA